MDALFRLGPRANLPPEVLAAIPDPPSYSAVRAHLRTLEDKGHIRSPGPRETALMSTVPHDAGPKQAAAVAQ